MEIFFEIRFETHEINLKPLKILKIPYQAKILKAYDAGWVRTQLNRDKDPNL
jgi:hypothetical protein